MVDRITNARVLRLLIHLPPVDGGRASVSFMKVQTTRGIPHAHLSLNAFLTNVDADPADPIAVGYVLRAQSLLAQQVQR